MKRALAFLAAFVLSITAAHAGIAARAAVDLKAMPLAPGETITLGDIFDGAGDAATTPVIAAPHPGQKLSINAQSLASLAADHGLYWSNPTNLTNVEVGRAGREVNASDIGAAISKALSLQSGGRDLDTSVLQSGLTLMASVQDMSDPRVSILAFDPQTGRFQAQVDVPGGNRAVINGVADEAMSVPVLARPFQRGEVVQDADVSWVHLRIDTIGRQTITDAAQIVGLAARRPLRSGQPLLVGDIERPTLVTKGARVTMSYRVAGMTLTDSGRAMQSGGMDDTIDVINERSHRTVQARVSAMNTVELSPAEPASAARQASLAQ